MPEAVEKGNFVSEWFGHRVFPSVASLPVSLDDQRSRRCPFLSDATGQERKCTKAPTSLGICTINGPANGVRKDWLVCPYRALDRNLVESAARRLFGIQPGTSVDVLPAPNLADIAKRQAFIERIEAGSAGVIFLQDKLGGEISVSPTDRSPELSFDITMIEIRSSDGSLTVGRYGILEVQTMDFHGSYRAVVNNLEDALRLHGDSFHSALHANAQWLSERIEGPNIANVFKRTFYQIILKFQIAQDESCAGCILALPTSVWDSWQRHLGKPDLFAIGNGEDELRKPNMPPKARKSWIFLFDIDDVQGQSPSKIVLNRVVSVDAEALSYFALEVAPGAAVRGVGAADRVVSSIRRRLAGWWPELGVAPVVIP